MRFLLPLLTLSIACDEAAQDKGFADECESDLVLDFDDDGTTHDLLDGCTSLWVHLPYAPAGEPDWGEEPVAVDDEVLRFDYRMNSEEVVAYVFTPVGDGTTELSFERADGTDVLESWSVTINVEIPE